MSSKQIITFITIFLIGVVIGTLSIQYVKGVSMGGILNFGNHRATGLATPTSSSDATTKAYIDAAIDGLGDQVGGLSGNMGMYSNKIPDFTPPAAYTEVCFKNGTVYNDQHSGGASTAGGNCVPGDTGFIIEKNRRTYSNWRYSKEVCLKQGMRLPEPFEWLYAYLNSVDFGLTIGSGGMDEWASNRIMFWDFSNQCICVPDFWHSQEGYCRCAENQSYFRCAK